MLLGDRDGTQTQMSDVTEQREKAAQQAPQAPGQELPPYRAVGTGTEQHPVFVSPKSPGGDTEITDGNDKFKRLVRRFHCWVQTQRNASRISGDLHTTFTAASLTVSKRRKQASVHGQVNRRASCEAAEYDSAFNTKDVLTPATTWWTLRTC